MERRNGGFIIGDRLVPRVRTYAEDGTLEAGFGRFGDGPMEFRRIVGLGETTLGRIGVASLRTPWLTSLSAALEPDTLMPLDDVAPVGLLTLQNDYVLLGRRGDLNGPSKALHRLHDGRVLWSAWRPPASDQPYWVSFGSRAGGILMTVASDSLFAMTPLLYPAAVFNESGDSVGTIGTPPPSFRQIPEFEPGAFAFSSGGGPPGQSMQEALTSFDVVAHLDVVAKQYLLFTLGQFDETIPYPSRILHTRLEVYDRHTGVKLFEDVPLPTGVKVLGGGRYLYVLQNPDIPPWRIAKYRLRCRIESVGPSRLPASRVPRRLELNASPWGLRNGMHESA